MAHHDITQAVMAEAHAEINQPYSSMRKLKGYLHNKFAGGVRSAVGAAATKTDAAKQLGSHAVGMVPKALAFAAKQIPIVGSAASTLLSKGGPLAAKKVQEKLDEARLKQLRGREAAGSLTVKEMTEMLQREDAAVTSDTMTKLHDSIRKLDEAYAAARTAIQGASDCESVYKAAKAYSYLKYRVVRMTWYLETVQVHLDEMRGATDRYSAEVIGYEADLMEAMDGFFSGPASKVAYHKANCKNKEACYFHAHGMTT
jgi:hypothetical protein